MEVGSGGGAAAAGTGQWSVVLVVGMSACALKTAWLGAGAPGLEFAGLEKEEGRAR